MVTFSRITIGIIQATASKKERTICMRRTDRRKRVSRKERSVTAGRRLRRMSPSSGRNMAAMIADTVISTA